MVDALLLFFFNVRCLNYSTAQKQVNHRTHPVCVRVWRLTRSNFKQTRLCPAFVTHVVTFGPLPFVSLATSDYNVDEWLGIIICISHIVDDHKWLRKVPGKLSEAVRSDDHVRDNPGGQVACYCAELKLFSVVRLSRILLTNWPWTSQRVWTWAASKTFRTKWSTSSERQSSHGTLGRTCIGHSMFLWTVTPKKCLASHIGISGKWVWQPSHLISSQQYMRITSERPLELTTKSLEVAHRNMSRWYCSDARGVCWLMRWLPRVAVFWTYDRDLSMFAWVCCRTSFVMWN